MKTPLITALAAISLAFIASAAEPAKHDHDHDKIKGGPTGGRLITEVEPHAEFFVNAANKIEVRFVDDDNKVVAPAAQVVSVIMGDRRSPTKLAFAREGDKLISDKAIPQGNDLPTVVQIRENPEAKSVTAKFNLNLEDCPTCDNKEYACICAHEHDHGKKK